MKSFSKIMKIINNQKCRKLCLRPKFIQIFMNVKNFNNKKKKKRNNKQNTKKKNKKNNKKKNKKKNKKNNKKKK